MVVGCRSWSRWSSFFGRVACPVPVPVPVPLAVQFSTAQCRTCSCSIRVHKCPYNNRQLLPPLPYPLPLPLPIYSPLLHPVNAKQPPSKPFSAPHHLRAQLPLHSVYGYKTHCNSYNTHYYFTLRLLIPSRHHGLGASFHPRLPLPLRLPLRPPLQNTETAPRHTRLSLGETPASPRPVPSSSGTAAAPLFLGIVPISSCPRPHTRRRLVKEPPAKEPPSDCRCLDPHTHRLSSRSPKQPSARPPEPAMDATTTTIACKPHAASS